MHYKTPACHMCVGEKGHLRKRVDRYIDLLTQHRHQPLGRRHLDNESRVWPQTTCRAIPVCSCEHEAWLGVSPSRGSTLSRTPSEGIYGGRWAIKRSSGIPKACLSLRLPFKFRFAFWILEVVPAVSHFATYHFILKTTGWLWEGKRSGRTLRHIKEFKYMVTKKDLTLDGKHRMQSTDVL